MYRVGWPRHAFVTACHGVSKWTIDLSAMYWAIRWVMISSEMGFGEKIDFEAEPNRSRRDTGDKSSYCIREVGDMISKGSSKKFFSKMNLTVTFSIKI